MANQKSNKKPNKKKALDDAHWQYFLKLESDFFSIAQYLGDSEINDTACSIEFAQQIVCINTECEGLIKQICKVIDPKSTCTNMGHYKRTIFRKFPDIYKAPVYIDQFRRTLHPFAGWNGSGGRLEWWNAFQDVKYHRDNNFEKANLINTLEALCALLILEHYLYACFSPQGAERLGGTTLLKAPGMPGTKNSAPKFLPHLPLKEKKPELR